MSVHEAVSCDVCMKSSFSGNRYKCLICYDYDLCANCFEAGATSVQHLTQHPMQCVLARADYDLYYAGEESNKNHMPYSFTCPFCGQMGHSDSTLSTHVSNEHAEDSYEVVCPICAATPGGDPNRVTQDLIGHLMMEHRVSGQDFDETRAVLAATSTEPQIPQNVSGSGVRGIGRTHSVAHQYHSPGSTGSSLSPSGGQESETIESMSELLYQLSALKGRSSTIQSISTQLQQLELQLQSTRHQLEILPFRTHSHQAASRQQQCPGDTGTQVTTLSHGGPCGVGFTAANAEFKGVMKNQYLLSQDDNASMTELELENADGERADKALFVQELLIIALVEDLASNNNSSNGEETAEKSETAETHVPVCSPLLPAAGHLPKSNCDKKLVPTTCKEYVARETTLAPGGIVTSHQSLDRVETHTPKIRLHLPQKVNKHKSGKEMPPPKK